jgi:malate synthase
MSGDRHRLADLHRAERTGDFQIQMGGNREMQLALRQQMVLGVQKQKAEVPVRPSVVTLDDLAEGRAGWMASPGAAQVHTEHFQFLSHWNPAVVEGWAAWAGPF